MVKSNNFKKVSKKFSNFTEEEQWLQSMLQDGWVLKSYDSEDIDDCQYVFEPLQYAEQKNRIYKIDFRMFNKKEDFNEYNSLFNDVGWIGLAKHKGYFKHIFYTDSPKTNKDIFSDVESYKAREKQKMFICFIYTLILVMLFIIAVVLYKIYGNISILYGGIMTLFSNVQPLRSYYRHRKVYKSLV
ncbi:DUF2812 domain-containing protein [Bacillus sp. BRMEA1]|uniref:DUF2812 domain-containing protein n=1 Tax=Neobacillus endophyticus TaxID=2738405 RepID=UPI001566BD74|nr:DUF2812 domain-containing protein [Neobacillus endophyticus]NRD80207.1 DUF2812 domain-containing protein [Neobacillus endophyticus]